MARIEEQTISGHGGGKHMFIPRMCPIGAELLAAVLRASGYRAEVLPSNDKTLAIGYKHTSGGECVPCPCTTGAFIHTMQERGLDPKDVVFFMPTACGPCRFGQYARLNEIIFQKLGWRINFMSPSAENAYAGLDTTTRKNMFHAIMIGDIIRKIGMKIRPYEKNKGETDAALDNWLAQFIRAFENHAHHADKLLARMVDDMRTIAVRDESRPLVGIVGEIYVRSDPFINQNLYRRIEELGGEAWLAPIGEWILYTSELSGMVSKERGEMFLKRIGNWLEKHWFHHVEKSYYDIADPILHDRHEPAITEVMEEGMKYLPWQFEGESVLTLGRAALFRKRDGARVVVNASPMFCMPGTTTTAIFPKLEREYDMQIICNFYDGSGDPNQSLVPCMHYLCERHAAACAEKAFPA